MRVSPTDASSDSAASSLMNTAPPDRVEMSSGLPFASRTGPKTPRSEVSIPVTFIRPTLSPVAGFEIGARSAMIGISPSMRSSSESWARRSSSVPTEKYGLLPVRPTESPTAEVRISSISPSPFVTSFRIE